MILEGGGREGGREERQRKKEGDRKERRRKRERERVQYQLFKGFKQAQAFQDNIYSWYIWGEGGTEVLNLLI